MPNTQCKHWLATYPAQPFLCAEEGLGLGELETIQRLCSREGFKSLPWLMGCAMEDWAEESFSITLSLGKGVNTFFPCYLGLLRHEGCLSLHWSLSLCKLHHTISNKIEKHVSKSIAQDTEMKWIVIGQCNYSYIHSLVAVLQKVKILTSDYHHTIYLTSLADNHALLQSLFIVLHNLMTAQLRQRQADFYELLILSMYAILPMLTQNIPLCPDFLFS